MPPTKKAAKRRAKEPAKKAAKKAAKAVRKKTPKAEAAAPAKKGAPKFGRAGTAGKAEGDAPVLAYIAQLAAPQRAIAEKVDAIVSGAIPNVRRAMKWSMPMYGQEGKGWNVAFAAFKNHCGVRFFQGANLDPLPPEGEGKNGRSVNYKTLADVDEVQLRSWVKQAAALPGWGS